MVSSKHCVKGGKELEDWVKKMQSKGKWCNICGDVKNEFYHLKNIEDIYKGWSINTNSNFILISFQKFKRLYLEKVNIYELW